MYQIAFLTAPIYPLLIVANEGSGCWEALARRALLSERRRRLEGVSFFWWVQERGGNDGEAAGGIQGAFGTLTMLFLN